MTRRSDLFCGFKLKPICMIIGYLHLISSVVDLFCHLITVAIVTNGFQCDVDREMLLKVTNSPYLEPFLLIINLGTHGFYPFPRIIKNHYNAFVEYMPLVSPPRCYPGMLHINLVDIMNLMINVLWLKIVISFVKGLHKRDTDKMGMFFVVSIVKILLQLMYFGYQTPFRDTDEFELYSFLKMLDIVIAIFLLMLVHKYKKFLNQDIAINKKDKPPTYMECVISTIQEPILKAPGLKEAEERKEEKEIEKPEVRIDTPN